MIAFGFNCPPVHAASCEQLRSGAASALSLITVPNVAENRICSDSLYIVASPSVFQYWLDRYILACDLGFEIYLAVLSLVAVLVEVL